MRNIFILFLIFILPFIPSCGRRKTDVPLPEEKETATASEEVAAEKFQPEQIFTYAEKTPESPCSSEPEEITLDYLSQPIEIKGQGFTRLVGYVDGLLLVEVGGQGRLLKIGDKIGSYKVAEIRLNEVRLINKEN